MVEVLERDIHKFERKNKAVIIILLIIYQTKPIRKQIPKTPFHHY